MVAADEELPSLRPMLHRAVGADIGQPVHDLLRDLELIHLDQELAVLVEQPEHRTPAVSLDADRIRMTSAPIVKVGPPVVPTLTTWKTSSIPAGERRMGSHEAQSHAASTSWQSDSVHSTTN